MKKLITLFLFISATALAADPINETPTNTPKEACEAIVKAGIDDNFKAFMELTIVPTGHDKEKNKNQNGRQDRCGIPGMNEKNLEKGFHKMHEKHLELLKSISCKDEKIAGDRSWVEATSKEESRLIPFKVADGKWKFDMKTYFSFYHPAKDSMVKKPN